MMLRLSRQTVRRTWPPYVGAFIALSCGVVLIASAVTLAQAVDATLHRPGITAEETAQLTDLSSLFGIMAGVSMFMAVFVVSSAFGFVVATRRRELGLLRLVGATPRQVRRMVVGEAAVVAVLASVAGCLLAAPATPAFLALLRARGVTDLDFSMPSPWLAWAVAAPSGILVALLGSWRASKRAGRVSPVAALQESVVERRRPTAWQLVIGTLCLSPVVAAAALAGQINPVLSLVLAILLPEVVVVGLICFGGLIFPALAGLLGRPFARRDVAARLARDHVRTAVRTPAALAAPILAISAIAGSMVVALSFTADWATAMDRAQLLAPLVVETDGDARVSERLAAEPGLAVVDARTTVEVEFAEREREPVEAVDLPAIRAARGLTAVEGDLAGLASGGVAVTEAYSFDQGADVGDRLELRIGDRAVRPRVVAVVTDAPDLYAEVLVPRTLVADELRGTVPDVVFVDPGEEDVSGLLAGTRGRVLTADAWIDQVDQQTRAANETGLWVLLGPAGLYAGISIVNAVLVGVSQRRKQFRTIALLGATEDQLRRAAMWEAGLVGAAALLVGGVVTGYVGWLVRQATAEDVAGSTMTVPWLPLLAIVATCVGLALLAALAGSHRAARRSR